MSGRGRIWPAEARRFRDPRSRRVIRQVTDHPSIHHHPFFFVPAWDRAMTKLVFVSHRSGAPQILFEDRATGRLVQATDRADLAAWSLHPSPCGRFAYYTAGTAAFRVNFETFAEEELASFGAVEMREKGMVGAAMGTTALSASGRWWAVPVRAGAVSRFVLIDTQSGETRVFLERDTIGHPQFCPDDEDLILYAGPMTDRVWVTDRSGARNRRAYAREDRMQWITHETWIPGRREIAFVDWPRGMQAVHADSGATRWITRFPAWHAVADASGERIVCDTTFPDRGLHLLPVAGDGEARFLCVSEASSQGAHWGGPFPYNDGPVAVEAAQHTHPHPRFSPDGTRVVFTSDRTGHAQIYEVTLDEGA
ncbi:oligogalacturonate lyase family protein [Roseomonas sp. AR75]|uniref:oligogalacturonate lyase family protein n=1 Tax=Roseomonas sp. AR75 TaxID=2562311 RepID=UPI0010BFAB05|nr:oligogalacturonate lyase family protein [Roseomonas sp. AR75]